MGLWCSSVNVARESRCFWKSNAASRQLNSAWKLVIVGVIAPNPSRKTTKFDPSVLLCDNPLSMRTIELLSKGPKFALALPTKKVDKLASAHQVAASIPETQRQDFLGSEVCACVIPPPSTTRQAFHSRSGRRVAPGTLEIGSRPTRPELLLLYFGRGNAWG